MVAKTSFEEPLKQVMFLLNECERLGLEMIEAASTKEGFDALVELNRQRTRRMEEMQQATTVNQIDFQALQSAGETGQDVLRYITVVVNQNELLQTAISKRQQDVSQEMSALNRAERAGKAYGQWHPVRMQNQLAEEF